MQVQLTTRSASLCNALHMARPTTLHPDPPMNRHFIAEWAAKAEKSQADLARAMEIDKSVVSRWFKGNRPQDRYLADLATVLGAPEPLSLFRHPDDDWIARFLQGRSDDERTRIRQTLETAFPRRVA